MASYVEGLIERVLGELHHLVKTETVVGEPVIVGDLTLIPVSKISFGFGAGGGGQDGKGQSGTGGGATVEPIAFLMIDGDGKAQILPLQDKEGGLGHLVDLMPEALAKVKQFVGRKKKEPADASEEDEQVEAQ